MTTHLESLESIHKRSVEPVLKRRNLQALVRRRHARRIRTPTATRVHKMNERRFSPEDSRSDQLDRRIWLDPGGRHVQMVP